MSKKYYIYIIKAINKDRFYIGYTVDLIRRLKQHNREIKGGARATSRDMWSFLILIKCDTWTKNQALSFEWHLKSHKRGWKSEISDPIERRFDLLKRTLVHEKFKDLTFDIWINPVAEK